MIAANTAVFWTPTDRTGNPTAACVATRTVGPSFTVERNSDGQLIECVILSVNRLVPVWQLHTSRPVVAKLAAASASKRETPAFAKPATRPVLATTPATAAPAAKREPTSAAPAAKPAAAPEPCDVLAVDFLNLLVRAFHAGKPTETHAVRSMFQTVANAIRILNPKRVVFALDGGHKRRSELLPQYKAHRPEPDPLLTAQKALAESAIHMAGFQAIRVNDWEADDVIATIATKYANTVVASCDKDLLSLTHSAERCRVFHPWGAGEFMTADEKLGISANLVTDYLSLCGDTSDGIPGAKGIGPKTAVQLLNEYGSLEAIIVAAMTGQIKGATGTKLKEQRDDVLICHRVVGLNTRLAIPELSAFRPVAAWQQRLTEIRLGSVAAIMDSIASFRCCDPDREPAIAKLPEQEPAFLAPKPMSLQGATTESIVHKPESIAAPRESSMAKPGTQDSILRSFYAGQRCRRESILGREISNPFRRDVPEFAAWQNGFDGRELNSVSQSAKNVSESAGVLF